MRRLFPLLVLVLVISSCGGDSDDAFIELPEISVTTTSTTTAPTTTTTSAPVTTMTPPGTTTLPPTTTVASTAPVDLSLEGAPIDDLAAHLHVLAPTLDEAARVFGLDSIDGSMRDGEVVVPIEDWVSVPAFLLAEYSTRSDMEYDSFVQLEVHESIADAAARHEFILGMPVLFGPEADMSTVRSTFDLDVGFDTAIGHVLDGSLVLENPVFRVPFDLTIGVARVDRVVSVIGTLAPTGAETREFLSQLARYVPAHAAEFGSILDTPRLYGATQPAEWFALKSLEPDTSEPGTWSDGEWTVRLSGDRFGLPVRSVERDGVYQFDLIQSEFALWDHLQAMIRDGATETEMLMAEFTDFARSQIDGLTEEDGWNGVRYEVVPLEVAGNAAVRWFVTSTSPEGFLYAVLGATEVDGLRLIVTTVDTDFFEGEYSSIVDFVPVFDRFLRSIGS